MLSRIMRHPAGLVKKALGGRFLTRASRQDAPPAAPPDYWLNRFSNPGFALLSPIPLAPGSSHVGLVHGLHPEASLLPSHGGKTSSYLGSAPRMERKPASHP